MFYEPLEKRRLLAATSPASVKVDPYGAPTIRLTRTGTLVVSGSAARETVKIGTRKNGRIAVDFFRTVIRVPVDDTTSAGLFVYNFSFDARRVKRFDVGMAGGHDTIVAGTKLAGRSTLSGGAGDEVITTSGRRMILLGGSGDDTLTSEARARKEIPVFQGDIAGGVDRDPVTAIDATYNVLSGSDGNDTLRSTGGEDSVSGGAGNDTFFLKSSVKPISGTLPPLQYLSDVNYLDNRVSIAEPFEHQPIVDSIAPVNVRFSSFEASSFQEIMPLG